MIPFRLKHLVYTLRRLLKYCAVNSWTSGSSLCVVCCRVSFRRGAHSIAKPLPASAIFLSFFFLSQHFPSVERVCAFCSALWDANFTASSSDLHRPSLWARWRQQQRRFRGSMDFCSVPISWYPYNRALYIVARLGSINVLCICIYIAHECVYSFPHLSRRRWNRRSQMRHTWGEGKAGNEMRIDGGRASLVDQLLLVVRVVTRRARASRDDGIPDAHSSGSVASRRACKRNRRDIKGRRRPCSNTMPFATNSL